MSVHAPQRTGLSNAALLILTGFQIGSGSFATVFLGKHNETGATFAIKKIPLPSGKHQHRQQESLEREINVLKQCRSPFIVSYFGSFVAPDGKDMCIVMEYLAGGTLHDVIKEYNKQGGLDETSTHGVVCQVLRGLDYLHENGFMHRDLKTKNILIDVDGSTKLADFGVSRELDARMMARSMVGTPLFMAPEVLAGEAYTTVADVWSFGICVLHIVNGDIPRRGIPVRDLMRMVQEQAPPKIENPQDWSLELGAFLQMCLTKEPGTRARTKHLLASAWVTGKKEEAEATKTQLKERTIGRASGITGTPTNKKARPTAAAAVVATPPHLQHAGNEARPVPLSPALVASPTPEVVAGYEEQPMDDVVKELLGWKQLALKLLDERDRAKK